MVTGYVKLRRGIVEHLPGRLTFEEYGIYVLIILKADHRTGTWHGCSLALSRLTGKSERWCRYRLASLRKKGYIKATPSNGRGRYMISVEKYFEKRHPVSTSGEEAAPSVRISQNKRHPVSPYQEVKTYKKKREEVNPRKSGAAPPPVPEQEQRRRIEARQKRLQDESDLRFALSVGAGPVCRVPDLWTQVKAIAAKKSL